MGNGSSKILTFLTSGNKRFELLLIIIYDVKHNYFAKIIHFSGKTFSSTILSVYLTFFDAPKDQIIR